MTFLLVSATLPALAGDLLNRSLNGEWQGNELFKFMALSSASLWEPPAVQLEAVRQLQCGINSSESLQVMGETAHRQGQGE